MSRVTGMAPTCPTAKFQELSLETGAGTAASQQEQKRNLQGGDALQQVVIYKIPLRASIIHPTTSHTYPEFRLAIVVLPKL